MLESVEVSPQHGYNTVELFSTPYMYAQHQGSTRTCYKVRVEQVRIEHMFCVAQHGLYRTNGIRSCYESPCSVYRVEHMFFVLNTDLMV